MKLPRRYTILGLITVVSLLVCSIQADDEATEARPTVITQDGPVQGIKELSTLGKEFYSFYGIPFARPPIGNLRLKDPVPGESWEETLDASEAPPACMQVDDIFQPEPIGVIGEEDCLYLNIFTPVNTANITRILPVMIYIHGGAFLKGSASEYQPHVMMNEDIVLVVIQYRLGALGFMSTEDTVMSGNYGLKDQTLALKWIQENIHNFGGHSLKITIFGESAGAASVHYQILSPKSLGMFHQAILQSGSALCGWAQGAAHREVAKYTGALFNCSSSEDDDEVTVSKKLEQCFNNLDAEDLVGVAKKFMVFTFLPILLGPRVDDDFLPQAPEMLMQESRFKRVQMMSGVTSHEGGLFSLPLFGNEFYRGALQQNFANMGPVLLDYGDGDVAPVNMTIKMFDHYVGDLKLDVTTADKITRMLTDRHFTHCHDLTTTLHARTVAPRKSVFRYEFSYRGQLSISDRFSLDVGKDWVTHADELHYLFQGGLWRSLENEDDLKMRNIMTKLWSNFATYGHPTSGSNDSSLEYTWDKVPAANDDYQYFDITLEPGMKPDTRKKDRDFLLHLPTKQNFILFPEKMKDLKLVPVKEAPEENKSEPKVEDKQDEKVVENEPEEIVAEPTSDNIGTSTDKKDEL